MRGAQGVSRSEGVLLRRVEGEYRSASPVDRSLCSLELVDRAAPWRSAAPVDRSLCSLELGERADALGEGRGYVKMAGREGFGRFGKVFDNDEL